MKEAEPSPMLRKSNRATFSILPTFAASVLLSMCRGLVVLGLITLGVWGILAQFDHEVLWEDRYPNSSTAILDTVRARGAGTYDLAALFHTPIKRICISKSGRDPRSLARDEWSISEKTLLADKEPLFSMEGVFSIIVFDDVDFKIESMSKREITFRDDPGNRCADRPGRVFLEVRERSNPFDSAFTGKLHIE